MNKQTLYISLINAAAGLVFSLLLKGGLLICVLLFIVVGTILFIERRWTYENIFKGKKWRAVGGYAAVGLVMIGFTFLLMRPARDVSMIVKEVHHFLDHIRPEEYKKAYEALSEISQKTYPLNQFVNDHEGNRIKVQDFRIDKVLVNEFDPKKAVVMVSSPFRIYGKESVSFEMVKENGDWKVVLTRAIVQAREPSAIASSPGERARRGEGEKKKDGSVSHFFKSIF